MKPTPLTLAAGWLLAVASGSTLASTPVEKVVCTDLPPARWMSEQQARAQFKASSYLLVKFKVSKGRCHEFYAVKHDGTVVEAYVHPVTGKTVRMTRVPPQPGAAQH
jgi:hypothetical protein